MSEQVLWSILNFGVNLILIRFATPVEYGTFSFWANCGYVLASLMNALSVSHLFTLAPGDIRSDPRLSVERIMHGVSLLFMLVIAIGSGLGAYLAEPRCTFIDAIAPALYLSAFLLQNYIRSLAFSRGRIRTALAQTGFNLVLTFGLTFMFANRPHLTSTVMMLVLGGGFALSGLISITLATLPQWQSMSFEMIKDYKSYIRDSGWILVGVTSTESLARFYAFATTAGIGAAALASLSATQQLLRPIPLLASSISSAERARLAEWRDRGDFKSIVKLTALISCVGVAICQVWTFAIMAAWPIITGSLFVGKYAGDQWMVLLWGEASAIGFCQVMISATIQSLRAFKALAIVNLVAAIVSAATILLLMRFYGVAGAIIGTAIGQALEALSMLALLRFILGRASIAKPVKSMIKP